MNIKKFFENKEQKNIINEDNKKAIVKNNPFSRLVGNNVSARLKKLGKKLAPKAQTQAATYFDEEHGKLVLSGIEYRLGSDGRLECYDKTLRNKNIEILPLIH